MKLFSIIGARPQFVKIAPLVRAIERRERRVSGLEHLLLHTGQHYDPAMSDVFFSELDLPAADYNLGVGSGPHGEQTARMLAGIEKILMEVRPDAVVVYGDTNSTLAGALAGVKLHIPVAHVEAGLRSFRREMPEEINRLVADHVSDLLLAPTSTAMANLNVEGLGSRGVLCGDLMYDTLLHYRTLADHHASVGEVVGLQQRSFAVATVHRAENTDDLQRLRGILDAFNEIAATGTPLVFPVHPRTRHRIRSELAGWKPHKDLHFIEPVGYLDMLWLLDHALVALTDSGGLQKEAFIVGCPCVTLRNETEWVETVELGGNVLAGADGEQIVAAVSRWRTRAPQTEEDRKRAAAEAYGGGKAADRILDAVLGLEQGEMRLTEGLPGFGSPVRLGDAATHNGSM